MAKKKAALPKGDLADISAEWKQNCRSNWQILLFAAKEAFGDLEISHVFDEASGQYEVEAAEDVVTESYRRVNEAVHGLHDAEESIDQWIDIANREFNLNISESTPVDSQLAIRIGRAIKARAPSPQPAVQRKPRAKQLSKVDDRNKFFYHQQKKGKSAKEIAAAWNDKNNDDVSEEMVRQGISRHKRDLTKAL